MIRTSRLVLALAATALLAACASDTDTPLAPSDAAFNNGYLGSGNAAGGGTSSFGGTSSSTNDGGDPVPSDSTGRGGHIVGGN